MLAEKYMNLIKGKQQWPPIRNMSIVNVGSGWNTKEFQTKFFKDQTELNVFLLIKEGEGTLFLTENRPRALTREVFLEYLKDQAVLDKRTKIFYKNIHAVDQLYKQCTKGFVSKNDFSLLKTILKKTRDCLWDANGVAYFTMIFDKKMCWELIQEANFRINEQDFEKTWDKGTDLAIDSFERMRYKDLLKALTNKKLSGVTEDFEYFYTNFFEAKNLGYVQEHLAKDYPELVKGDASEILKQEQEKTEQKIKEFKQWHDKLNMNQQILVDFFQRIMELRDARKNFFSKGFTIIWRIARKLFEKQGLRLSLIPLYSYYELIKGEEYLEKNKQEIIKRKDGCMFLVKYDGSYEFENCDYEKTKQKLEKFFIESCETQEGIIKGTTGYPGKVKGRVRIISDAFKTHEFEKGDILVTGMTRVEHTPLMNKAAAFVTAREMKKPCVLSTRIASRVLKDGDLVEVDATNGIVRKIK